MARLRRARVRRRCPLQRGWMDAGNYEYAQQRPSWMTWNSRT